MQLLPTHSHRCVDVEDTTPLGHFRWSRKRSWTLIIGIPTWHGTPHVTINDSRPGRALHNSGAAAADSTERNEHDIATYFAKIRCVNLLKKRSPDVLLKKALAIMWATKANETISTTKWCAWRVVCYLAGYDGSAHHNVCPMIKRRPSPTNCLSFWAHKLFEMVRSKLMRVHFEKEIGFYISDRSDLVTWIVGGTLFFKSPSPNRLIMSCATGLSHVCAEYTVPWTCPATSSTADLWCKFKFRLKPPCECQDIAWAFDSLLRSCSPSYPFSSILRTSQF